MRRESQVKDVRAKKSQASDASPVTASAVFDDEPSDGLLHDLTASWASRFWLALFTVAVFALICIGVAVSGSGTTSTTSSGSETSNTELETSAETGSNLINTAQLPDSSFIYDISIEELANADSYINEQTVQVTGEVVGDRIIAEDNSEFCWITLQSLEKSDSEVAVYLPVASTKAIDTYGAYGREGTHLQVRGTFYLACDDHQGSCEIHAENVAVVAKGSTNQLAFDPAGLIPGVLLILIGSVSMLVYNVLQERQR